MFMKTTHTYTTNRNYVAHITHMRQHNQHRSIFTSTVDEYTYVPYGRADHNTTNTTNTKPQSIAKPTTYITPPHHIKHNHQKISRDRPVPSRRERKKNNNKDVSTVLSRRDKQKPLYGICTYTLEQNYTNRPVQPTIICVFTAFSSFPSSKRNPAKYAKAVPFRLEY